MSFEERLAAVPAFRPELASCNAGSVNLSYQRRPLKFRTRNLIGKSLSLKEHMILSFPTRLKALTIILQP